MEKLFDEQGLLRLDEIVCTRASFQKIIEDSIIGDEEIIAQSNTVAQLLQKVEDTLNDDDKKLVIEVLCELAVLFQINALKGRDM